MQWATNCHTNENVVLVGHLREPIVVRGYCFAARNGNGPEDFLTYVPFQTSKFGRAGIPIWTAILLRAAYGVLVE
jgi:hypothetical protein